MALRTLQRGTISMTGLETTKDATITTVNTTKAFVRFLRASAGNSINSGLHRVRLVDAVTVRVNRTSAGGDPSVTSYEVVELT